MWSTAQSHSNTKDIIKAYNLENPRPASLVNLEIHKLVSFVIQCRNCEDTPCVTACLSAALTKDNDSGLVVHDSERFHKIVPIYKRPYGPLYSQ